MSESQTGATRGGSGNGAAGTTGMVVTGASVATAAAARAAAGAGVLCAPSPSSSFPFLINFFSSISNVYTLF